MKGIYSDGRGYCHCPECGHSWYSGRRWLWWPIRIKLAPHWAFASWGVMATPDSPGPRRMARIIAVGPLRVIFGDYKREGRNRFVPGYGWFPREQAVRLQEHIDGEHVIDDALLGALEAVGGEHR